MTKDEILITLFNEMNKTEIDFYNEETIIWSLAYRKGARSMYDKAKQLIKELD